jgi:hypothetical protein
MLVFDLSEPEIICLVETGEYLDPLCAGTEDIVQNVINEPDSNPEQKAAVPVCRIEKTYPAEWGNRFGQTYSEKSVLYFERIHYKGDWEILRPAKVFAAGGGVRPEILHEVEIEAQKMLQELGCAI